MSRTPKHISWDAVLRARLSAELARRGNPDMPAELVSKRILYTLHEAAHLVAAVWYRVPAMDVSIIDHRGRFDGGAGCKQGCGGIVRTYGDFDEADAAVSFAGAEFEALIHPGARQMPAWSNDLAEGLQTLFGHAHDHRDSELAIAARLEGSAAVVRRMNELADDVRELLLWAWVLVDATAKAILMYSDARGRLDYDKTQELRRHIAASFAGKCEFDINHSVSPRDLRITLGQGVTQFWREFAVQDDSVTWAETEEHIIKAYKTKELVARADKLAGREVSHA